MNEMKGKTLFKAAYVKQVSAHLSRQKKQNSTYFKIPGI